MPSMRGACLAGAPDRPHNLPMTNAIQIRLNGDVRTLSRPMTVAELLSDIGLDCRKVAVERNEEIVTRSTYSTTVLATGDSLEIVHFIGGG